jgi:hypothetical protein
MLGLNWFQPETNDELTTRQKASQNPKRKLKNDRLHFAFVRLSNYRPSFFAITVFAAGRSWTVVRD